MIKVKVNFVKLKEKMWDYNLLVYKVFEMIVNFDVFVNLLIKEVIFILNGLMFL